MPSGQTLTPRLSIIIKLQAIARGLLNSRRKILSVERGPRDVDVNSFDRDFGRSFASFAGVRGFGRSRGIMDGLQGMRRFTEARHYRFAEFLGADLLLAGAFLKNVVSVDAVLHGAQPGIVYALGHVRLIEMHQHQDAT